MTRQQSSLLTFAIVLAGGSAIAAIVGLTAWIAYVAGVLATMTAAAIANLVGD